MKITYKQINLYHSELLTYYLDKLESTPDIEGTLLDNIMVMYACSMSDGNDHILQDLPCILFGGGSGQLKGGKHIRYADDTPISNLYVTLLEKLGLEIERFGDSNGTLNVLSVS